MSDAVPVPAAVKKLAETKRKKRADRIRRWAQDNIAQWAENLKEETQKLARAEEKAADEAAKWAQAVARLRAAGFKVELSDYDFDVTVKTTRKKLTDVYRAIGRLNPQSVAKSIVNAKKKLIRVAIDSVAYPFVTVVYVHKLGPNDKCKIVEEKVPARVQHNLVCERQ
jgi:hypothetical protein